jgi:hypothetical protein
MVASSLADIDWTVVLEVIGLVASMVIVFYIVRRHRGD